ncbi:4-alpha-glucanotransferase [Knoellia subterranea]|uniref:4-alpha-glucanotransferase n=1 Tax=Knoellia subterranea KCTC 19937 TaxID=1385521 RepID=A0A0A0JQL6_9MICO|nr:4-alpha-glucanotransferase [Knoellia subterranea]KGN39458.1 4-alpha-glucanotransferase [Knoellia subterranea KCTC 19937]
MTPVAPSDTLVALARAHGVATDFHDWKGTHTVIGDASLRTVLAALGVDASSEEAVAASLADAENRPWRRTLPATVVCREGWTPWVHAHVPDGGAITLTVELEDGSSREVQQVDRWVHPREIDGRLIGEATFELPGDLPLGWHRIVAHLDQPAVTEGTAVSTLVVTPGRLELPEVLRHGGATGLMTQIYQARSATSWGIGDLGDLADLASWAAGDVGAEFVLINPLHAAEPVAPMEESPYLPTTRRFVNPIYLRIEGIPELVQLGAPARSKIEELAATARALNAADTIDRDAAWAAKREALGLIHAVGLDGRRARDFDRYRELEGEGLATFATWCALAERHGLPWTEWPSEYHDPSSPAVAEFAASQEDLVNFHMWLQWLLDRQLGEVQREAKSAGMSLGIVHDLAVGVHPEGADSWGLADALAKGVTVGAPPDQFNQLGQNWSQPPWHPERLAELGYAPFRDMVRTVLRDSGGVRVDHVIGLFRLWWIPEGEGLTPADGTYVTYDHEALIGILCLEAQRAGAVVIGEDLGVVPAIARDYLLERGVLGTSIMWFENTDDQPTPPENYRELCLSSVTTHDLPPTAGFLALEHVAIRERLGLLTRPVEEERAHEEQSLAKVRDALVARGWLEPAAGNPSVIEAMHRWLGHTPSVLRAVALADVVGDRRAINQPGTDDEYPNWRLPLAGPDGEPISLEQAMQSEFAEVLFRATAGD